MALERTTLSSERIASLLTKYYKIHIDSVRHLPLGSANCYRVYAGGHSWFLKEFQTGFSEDDAAREADLTEYLRHRGIPTAGFIRTESGDASFTENGRVICLQKFVPGENYGYNNFPTSMLENAAKMLGRIHRALENYALPSDMDDKWLAGFSPERLAEQYLELEKDAERDPLAEQITKDLRYKAELSFRCSEYLKFYDGITRTPTHGDYQGCQLICTGSTIRAVIDFSSARTLPAVWEIMRSFVQTSRQCRNHAVIDLEGLVSYIRAYCTEFPLTKRDLISMPYVYLFQLARSKYGYSQYLHSDSEDRLGLLNFALWRTQMCRQVESRLTEISEALVQLR